MPTGTNDNVGKKIERFLVRELPLKMTGSEGINDLQFFPSKSNNLPVPPFVVVQIVTQEERMSRSNVYYCTGTVVLITDIDHNDTDQHAQWVGEIKQAIDEVAQTLPFNDPGLDLTIHGIDIDTIDSRLSSEDHVHGDFINIVVGASG